MKERVQVVIELKPGVNYKLVVPKLGFDKPTIYTEDTGWIELPTPEEKIETYANPEE